MRALDIHHKPTDGEKKSTMNHLLYGGGTVLYHMIETIMSFIVECDKLKSVLRRTTPVAVDRRENSAEHSWSLSLMAISLFPTADPSLDQLRVLKMLLIHDVIEIDAGDTYCYDTRADKESCERLAAERIFGMLPGELSHEFMELWNEFEAAESKESAFANALDRLLPLIQNFHNGGRSWMENGITYEQAYSRNLSIRHGSKELWEYAEKLLMDAFTQGILPLSVDLEEKPGTGSPTKLQSP